MDKWTSEPMGFGSALRVWSAAAGIAGAYVPDELWLMSEEYILGAGSSEGMPDLDVAERVLRVLLDEAERRAHWRAQYGDVGTDGLPILLVDYIPPRTAEIADGALVWRTSVDTVLRYDGGWCVEVRGEHVTRVAAAKTAISALS